MKFNVKTLLINVVYCLKKEPGVALHYQSDGPGIDPRWCHWGFFAWYPRYDHVP